MRFPTRAESREAWSTPTLRRRAVVQLWLVNVAFGTFLGTGYLIHVPDGAKAWLFALPALVSTVITLTLLPGVLFTLSARLLHSPRTLGWVQAVTWTVFQVLLFADTRIYNVFRYHFGGQVWNLLYTRGSEDSVHLGWQVWTAVTAGLAGTVFCQLLVWGWILIRLARESRAGQANRQRLKPALVWCAVLLPTVFLEKTIYAQADLSRDKQVTALSRIFPLYARLPVDDLASRVMGVEVEDRPWVELEDRHLQYPLEMPAIDAEGPRPNVLVVVIDCWRQDMLSPEVSPRLWEFARGCRRFEDHVSAGNSTRFGLLSMLYGLHGSYWFPVLAEGRSPVLVDALLKLDYDMQIVSSASMGYPELRQTAWSRIPEAVEDDFGAVEAWRRDEQAAEALVDWLDGREDTANPFFGFVLLDSAHQTYSHPPGAQPFRPTAPEVNYVALSKPGLDRGMLHRVFNRYRNAVHHADDVAGELLEQLEAHGLLENTLVFVTGDHGEEFLETGFFGHTSAFTDAQIRVPLLVRGPGVEPGVEERPTSHLDLPATVLESLGADPTMRSSWTLGANLFEPDEGRRRVMSGWNELGMWAPGGIVRIPLSRFEFDVEVYDRDWGFIADDREILAEEAQALAELAAECNRFLK